MMPDYDVEAQCTFHDMEDFEDAVQAAEGWVSDPGRQGIIMPPPSRSDHRMEWTDVDNCSVWTLEEGAEAPDGQIIEYPFALGIAGDNGIIIQGTREQLVGLHRRIANAIDMLPRPEAKPIDSGRGSA